MVMALPECCRQDIESSFGSIIAFKKSVYDITYTYKYGFSSDELIRIMNAIADALVNAVEYISQAIHEALEYLLECMRPFFDTALSGMKELAEKLEELYDTEDSLYLVPKDKHIPVIKYEKVPFKYVDRAYAPKIYRCRNNC